MEGLFNRLDALITLLGGQPPEPVGFGWVDDVLADAQRPATDGDLEEMIGR